MDVSIGTIGAVPTAKRPVSLAVPLHVAVPVTKADPVGLANTGVHDPTVEASASDAPADGAARTTAAAPPVSSPPASAPLESALTPIRDTVTFHGVDLLDVDDPTGTITVGTKTLDLATVDYLPTDGPAARAIKLRAAIAAVFGSATSGAAGGGVEDASTGDLLVAVRDLFASQLGVRDSDLAEERVTTTRERILSEAGAAIDAQAGDLPGSVLQLLR